MWLALASASLGEPLAIDLARDLATALRASERLAEAPVDLIWAAGPEAGAAVLFAAASGALGDTDIVVSDGPGDLDARASASQYPPWSVIVPGLLESLGDLDDIVDGLGERVTITSSGPGLRAPSRGPFEARAEGAAVLLERVGAKPWHRARP
jgi:hypothetical protein